MVLGIILAVDYRLAPDSPFPAAIHDALAAYLYLLDPPADSGFAPVDPKNIVIMGDSAGGGECGTHARELGFQRVRQEANCLPLCVLVPLGLTFATMLAIRDAGLPVPAGIIGWSPWIDLLHSMPSIQENTATDYLPSEGFTHGGDASLKKLAKMVLAAMGTTKGEKIPPGLPAIQHYTNNNLLHCKYVSPVLEDNLEGTCPILIVSFVV